MIDHTKDECPHCHSRSRGGAFCWDCDDTQATFRSPFCLHETDFHSVRIRVQVIREDLAGRLSEYRGIHLTDDAPSSVAEWDAIRNAELPDDEDLSLVARDAQLRARSAYMQHVIALDHRLPFEVASCRAWHELMHAAYREIDPYNPRSCREAQLDAITDRIDWRDWPTPAERESLPEEAAARACEELTWTFASPLLENKRVTLASADVQPPRIIGARNGDLTFHPDHAAYWVEHMRRVGRAWELTGSTAFPFDRWYTVRTLGEHQDRLEFESELLNAAIELGVQLDQFYGESEPQPDEPQPGGISFGRLAVIRFPGIPQAVLDSKPPLRDVFALTLATHKKQQKEKA